MLVIQGSIGGELHRIGIVQPGDGSVFSAPKFHLDLLYVGGLTSRSTDALEDRSFEARQMDHNLEVELIGPSARVLSKIDPEKVIGLRDAVIDRWGIRLKIIELAAIVDSLNYLVIQERTCFVAISMSEEAERENIDEFKNSGQYRGNRDSDILRWKIAYTEVLKNLDITTKRLAQLQ